MIERTAAFWKWFAEVEDVDVFIITMNPTVEKNGTRVPVNTSLLQDTFGERLKVLHLIDADSPEHRDFAADLHRAASYIPLLHHSVHGIRNPARHFGHFWLTHKAFVVAGEQLRAYKRIGVCRSDVLISSLPSDPAEHAAAKAARRTYDVPCPTGPAADRTSWPAYRFFSQLKPYEPCVRQHPRWGFSVSDYFHYGTPDAVHALARVRDWMWVRVPLDAGAFPHREKHLYKSEAQFLFQRVLASNVTDLRHIGVPFSSVFVRAHGCYVEHTGGGGGGGGASGGGGGVGAVSARAAEELDLMAALQERAGGLAVMWTDVRILNDTYGSILRLL